MSVMAEIQGQTVILSCVYASCVSDPVFLPNIENKLHEFGTFPIIMGGDYNQVFDPILDRKPPNLWTHKSVSEVENSLLLKTQL